MGACLTSGSDQIVLVNHQGLSLRFYKDSTRSLRRASAGKRENTTLLRAVAAAQAGIPEEATINF